MTAPRESDPQVLRARLLSVSDALPFEVTVRPMMGGYIGYADGAVFVSLSRGGFGVKLTGQDHADLLARPGAVPLRHGQDHPPSRTYVAVPPVDLDDDAFLTALLLRAGTAAVALTSRRPGELDASNRYLPSA